MIVVNGFQRLIGFVAATLSTGASALAVASTCTQASAPATPILSDTFRPSDACLVEHPEFYAFLTPHAAVSVNTCALEAQRAGIPVCSVQAFEDEGPGAGYLVLLEPTDGAGFPAALPACLQTPVRMGQAGASGVAGVTN